ncbi:MAG TPA: homoserine dehydrogenase [Acidimicrobiales bacterium]|nr:homoserine dehydrogenase [Acidimicrobiales bacterium]
MPAPTAGAPVRIGLLGCGNVGAALVQILRTDAAVITARTGLQLEVARVAVRNVAKERQVELAPELLTHDAAAVVTDPAIDVVVELIGGIEPARGLILSALKSGKPVVTANKELMANVGGELVQVAMANSVDLLYEASVGGGIPLVRPLRESLAGERVRRVIGIVNGTTNYILTRMSEEGTGYAEALAEAQSLGYAERDPTADVEGFDAGAKAAILATIAFGVEVVSGDVYREGISGVTAHDIGVASRLGYVVKLLAIAEQDPGQGPEPGPVAVRVHPAMLPKDHPLASVRGSFNAVFVEGESVGELMFYGRGAGGAPSASAVLGDLIDAAHNLRGGGAGRPSGVRRAAIKPIDDLRSQYYLNIDVVDRPGVLAAVAQVFGRHDVSIRSMEQAGLGDEARLIFITHTAREADVQATVGGLHQLDVVKRVGSLLRVAGPE